MLTLMTRSTAALLLTTGLSVAQTTQVPATDTKKEATTATYRAKQILGTKVMLQGDSAAGTVDDLVFDDAGNLEYVIVDNGGKLTTVPWEAAKFNLEKKTAVLPLTAEQYKVIPTYTVTTYPSFYTPTYRTEVYRYYNLTPRELRRLGVSPRR
jgi:hypothetical protein